MTFYMSRVSFYRRELVAPGGLRDMNSIEVEDHRRDLGFSEMSARERDDGPAFHLSRLSIPEGAVNVVRRIYRELREGVDLLPPL